ncbi:MAG: autoinducer binding domain-containing protein, partial [Rhodobacteraceae bacterium]|nr:autoinducer binding domain-containing protein [Paracoccaceae bacterium]
MPAPTGKAVLDQMFIELGKQAPAGFSAGLHIRYASPLVYVRSYPEDWIRRYDEHAYAMRDPLVFWGLGVKGQTRWSEIKLPDPFNILGQAHKHGLIYGAIISCGPITSRSFVGMARADREFSSQEIDTAAQLTQALHDAATPPTDLTPAQVEALRLLADGDALNLSDKPGVIKVCAAPEDLIEITAKDTLHLVRLAWHLGNR